MSAHAADPQFAATPAHLVEWHREERATDAITFRTVVEGEQVIRPPAGVVLPQGALEVIVKPIREPASPPSARHAANERLRQHRVSLGRPTGIDNQGIDADLARVYADSSNAP